MGVYQKMKLIKILLLSGLYYLMMGGSNASASTDIYQCQLKNGHNIFSDTPCQNNQKSIPSKTDRKRLETRTAPTINIATMPAPTAHDKDYCANLNRLGIARLYKQRTRTAQLKYWRADQTLELKQALDNLKKMNDAELAGC